MRDGRGEVKPKGRAAHDEALLCGWRTNRDRRALDVCRRLQCCMYWLLVSQAIGSIIEVMWFGTKHCKCDKLTFVGGRSGSRREVTERVGGCTISD